MSKTVGIDLGTMITLDADGDELVVRWTVPGAEARTGEREEVTA